MTDQERQELIAETEERVINTMAIEIQEALIQELTPGWSKKFVHR